MVPTVSFGLLLYYYYPCHGSVVVPFTLVITSRIPFLLHSSYGWMAPLLPHLGTAFATFSNYN